MTRRRAVVFALAACSGCRALWGIEDPVLIDGDIVPGVELDSLELSSGELDRPFDGARSSYQARLDLAVEMVTVTAEARGTLEIYVDDSMLASGVPSAPIEIDVGASDIEVRVRRPSTGEESLYTIAVERLPRVAEAIAGPGDFSDRFSDSFHLDDDQMFVGAPCANAGGQVHAGKVYIYQRSESDEWHLTDTLEAPSPIANGFFGSAVGHDNGRLAVGARAGAGCGAASSGMPGQAFVFENVESRWQGVALVGRASDPDDRFGAAVSVDGDFIAVGAPGRPAAAISGAVHVFAFAGDAWSETDVVASPTDSEGAEFGADLDLNSNVLVVSSAGDRGGRVHAFHNESGVATPLGVAAPSQLDIDRYGPLGFGASLSTDDEAIVVGAPLADSGKGFVWVFSLDALASEIGFEARIELAEAAEDDFFGAAVDIDEDLIVVGAPGVAVSEHPAAGRAILWQRGDDGWSLVTSLEASVPTANGGFGAAIDLDELRVLVGAPGQENGFAYLLE